MSADDSNTDVVESFALPGSVPPELIEETEEVITGDIEEEVENPSSNSPVTATVEEGQGGGMTAIIEQVVDESEKPSAVAAAAAADVSSSKDAPSAAAKSNKGAQILMNRFSTWRANPNITKISSNAQSVFAKGSSYFPRNNAGNNATSPGGGENADDGEMSKSNSSGSSLEEEGHITTDDDGLRQLPDQSDDESVSSMGSSMDGDDDANAKNGQKRALAAALRAQTAASVVAESVSASFRGRYSSGTDNATDEDNTKTSKSEMMRQSQTALIMQSRAAKHMQSILDSLEPDEFVMLLGRGPLGVNLKQTYLKNNGVYLDYYVKGSSAEASGVTYAGDSLVKVGDIDVRKGTVKDVPETIGAAKRPCVLVFSTKHFVLESMNYIDIAVGMMHKIREDSNEKNGISSMPLTEKNTVDDDKTKSLTEEEGESQPEESEIHPANPSIPPHTFRGSNCMNPPLPSMEIKKFWAKHAAKRCNDDFSVTMMSHALRNDENFRAALRNAFVTCSMDGRRLPFLARFLAAENESYGAESSTTENEDTTETLASKQLLLFLDLMSFADLYGVAPVSRRRDMAKRIAFKFFLPSTLDGETTYPMFDFHHIVPDSQLRQLEQVLNDQTHPIEQTVFDPFRDAVVDLLSGATFIGFLVSDDCSRMRAYLRNTAPYTNVSLRQVFDAITSSNKDSQKATAGTHLSFIMMNLLCIAENGGVGTENDDVLYGKGKRVPGESAGMACAIFIQRDLMLSLKKVRDVYTDGENKASQSETKTKVARELFDALSHLWEVFVAPNNGSLESVSHSNETDAALDALRVLVCQQILTAHSKTKTLDELVDTIIKSELSNALTRLSDELLYDYATNRFSKYREDKMHEWMCNESSKLLSFPPEEKKDEDASTEGGLCALPQGCIRRVLRKLELPDGVSLHKPQRLAKQSSCNESTQHIETDKEEKRFENPNADFAVVFGTDDGLNLNNRITNPAMDNQDIRRYICQPVALDGVTAQRKQIVPDTLESYACTFPFTNKPFSQVADSSKFSSDGWEVALINFMIPNADASSDDGENGSIYGVSLVLTKPYEGLPSEGSKNKQTPIELVQVETTEDNTKTTGTPQKNSTIDKEESPSTPMEKGEEAVIDSEGNPIGVAPFASPLVFSPQKIETAEGAHVRQIRVSSETPLFNRRLKGTPWSERATKEDSSITVGIVLISEKNSIPAMRLSLSRLLFDQARSLLEDDAEESNYDTDVSRLVCGPLANLLGNFSHEDIEVVALKCVLEPYLRFGSSPWIDQPLHKQSTEFMLCAGSQLLQSLPPVPLALLFVSALLEQKIVFSSSRRSLLLSVTCAITELLQPLKWSHLIVPLAPSALATDLVQYPAPFILGIPSEDPGSMDLLNSLPEDVTLVDLDVGRVILARALAFDDGLAGGETESQNTARALRSQVLYLAQSLGDLFGARLQQQTWCCDSPSVTMSNSKALHHTTTIADFERLKLLCKTFINEILEGVPFCCFWVEENQASATTSDGSILFDEDQFFDIKNARAEGLYQPLFSRKETIKMFPSIEGEDKESGSRLALSLREFDLVLESFLRCQSMSTFISSCPKKSMAFY